MVKAISSEIAVSLNQEHLVYVLGQKERRNGARSVSVKSGTWSNPLPISVPSDPLGSSCLWFFFLSCKGSPQSPLICSFHWDSWHRSCPTSAFPHSDQLWTNSGSVFPMNKRFLGQRGGNANRSDHECSSSLLHRWVQWMNSCAPWHREIKPKASLLLGVSPSAE